MCGLYSFRKSAEETRALFAYIEAPEFPPRPHVVPGSPIAIVRLEHGERHFALVRWGLVPAWVKEIAPGKPLINARAETVVDKPSFRNALRRRRCLVPADGFYEWKGEVRGRKQPFHIHRPDDGLFAFAGLWEHWLGADGSELESAAIITTAANRTLAPIHGRMPVVIEPKDHARWLDAAVAAPEAALLLKPAPDDFFVAEPTAIARSPAPKPKPKEQLRLI